MKIKKGKWSGEFRASSDVIGNYFWEIRHEDIFFCGGWADTEEEAKNDLFNALDEMSRDLNSLLEAMA